MNRKQLVVILVVALVLGGTGLYLQKRRAASFSRTEKSAEGRLLGEFPVNDVEQLTLRGSSNQVNLVKGEAWTVRERNDYPANAGEIGTFVRKLWDLHAAQSQKIGASQLGRLELLDPKESATNAATVVELKSKDGKIIRSIRLGKESMRTGGDDSFGGGGWPNGRWLYLPEDPGMAFLVSEPFSTAQARPESWLSKDFFRVEKPKSIEVSFPEATNSWKVARETETGEWSLVGAGPEEKLDSAKTSGFSYALSSPSFDDVLPGNALAADGTNSPVSINISTFEGFNYAIHAGARTNDDYLMTLGVTAQLPTDREKAADEKPEDATRLDKEFKEKQDKLAEKLKQEQKTANWTYLVSSWTLDSLMKKRSELLAAKPESTPEGQGTGTAGEGSATPALEDPPLPAIHEAP